MNPVPAAAQLTRLWRTICPEGCPYPVDCKILAQALNITVHGEAIDDNFEAQLRIRGKRRAIIYNENIRETGRKNFCISHEIGHHSCHSDKQEYFCSSANLNDIAPHPQNIEQEANLFAATLLMPADDFRNQISGKSPTLALIADLAEHRYSTSLTATCMRLLELSGREYLGLVFVRDGKVIRWARSESMKWTGFGFKKGHAIAQEALFHNKDGRQVDAAIWLTDKNAPRWTLTQSSVDMPYYNQTLVLLQAERVEQTEADDDFEPELPSFH